MHVSKTSVITECEKEEKKGLEQSKEIFHKILD
jgi:hypothetical protein